MTLQHEIDEKRMQIHTAGYPMSIGELANMYRDKELEIHPAFQRYFRWSSGQKSKLIDSLLLGIPIPSIFVYMGEGGIWYVIDGVQRLSTIFEFMGILRDKDGNLLEPSRLEETEYLPSLEGVAWSEESEGNVLTKEQQIIIKRASIDVKIITRESDPNAQYDLFERLNTGGSRLSDQEIRNSLLIMVNKEFFNWILELKENKDFSESIVLTERQLDEQYDLELITRYLIFSEIDEENMGKIKDISTFMNKESAKMAKAWDGSSETREKFEKVFNLINSSLGENSFKRYDYDKDRFLGAHILSAYESISCGVAYNIDYWMDFDSNTRKELLSARIKDFWNQSEFRENSGNGVRASLRIKRTIPFARKFFGKVNEN